MKKKEKSINLQEASGKSTCLTARLPQFIPKERELMSLFLSSMYVEFCPTVCVHSILHLFPRVISELPNVCGFIWHFFPHHSLPVLHGYLSINCAMFLNKFPLMTSVLGVLFV